MTGYALHGDGSCGDFLDVVPVDRRHHLDHQPRRLLGFLVVGCEVHFELFSARFLSVAVVASNIQCKANPRIVDCNSALEISFGKTFKFVNLSGSWDCAAAPQSMSAVSAIHFSSVPSAIMSILQRLRSRTPAATTSDARSA